MENKKNKIGTVRKLFLILIFLFSVSVAMMIVNVPAMAANYGELTIALPNHKISGIKFTIWQVAPAKVSDVSSVSEAYSYLQSDSITGTTVDGTVVFTLKEGLYYVGGIEFYVEKEQTTISCDPFLVSIPMYDPSKKEWTTEVDAYPKEQYLVIDQFVGPAGDEDYDFTTTNTAVAKKIPVAVGVSFGYSILSSIPVSVGASADYVITDALASYLDFEGNVKVYTVPAMDTPVASAYQLNSGSLSTMVSAYTARAVSTRSSTTEAEYQINYNEETKRLTVTMTDAGRKKMGDRYLQYGDRYLLIKFDCVLNGTAVNGEELENGAQVNYSTWYTDTDGNKHSLVVMSAVTYKPVVYTGQIEVTKLEEVTGKVLEGAEFGIAESKEKALSGDFLSTGTTGKNGRFTFTGLEYGAPGESPEENKAGTTFWLAELTAPEGYKLLQNPSEIFFNYIKDDDGIYFAKVEVYNVKDSTQTPETETGESDVPDPTQTPESETGESNDTGNTQTPDSGNGSTTAADNTQTPGNETVESKAADIAQALGIKTGEANTLLIYVIIILLSLVVIVALWPRKKPPADDCEKS